jgi:phosphatidylserine/phosphatidylglycerophosphate/cardiolipin synthase-like enzyme
MQTLVKKTFLTGVAIFTIFTAGIIIGCTSNEHSNAGANQNTRKVDTVPDNLKGIHSFQAVGSVDAAFSPTGGITNMITNELATAKNTIHVQAYSFTSTEIITALINAKKRGVDVRIIIDKSNVSSEDKANSRSQKERVLLDSIVDSGILLKVDRNFQIAHSKIIIIDGLDVITGSFNFSYSAEHNNSENCLILHNNKKLAEIYEANWQWRWDATDNYIK